MTRGKRKTRHQPEGPPQRPVAFAARGDLVVGWSRVLTPANAPLRTLSVGRLRLDRERGPYSGRTGRTETVLHILVGQCAIDARGPWGRRSLKQLGGRTDVFTGSPTAVILGPGTSYTVSAVSPTADLAVANVRLGRGRSRPPRVVRPDDVRVHQIGEAHYERTVREVIGGEGPAVRLRVGETINPVGHWSSWPHHEFDANPKLAPRFEEVFLYFTNPRDGWALQRRQGLFCNLAPVDDVFVVRNGDAAVLPLGEHPIVAGVNSRVLYVWFYISPIPKIYAKWAEDIGGYA